MNRKSAKTIIKHEQILKMCSYSDLRCYFSTLCLLLIIKCSLCVHQQGPDPWDYGVSKDDHKDNPDETDFPMDFKYIPSKNPTQCDSSCTAEEWFFKRIFTIILKGGQLKEEDDGSTHVSIQMKFTKEKWKTLDDYMKNNARFTDQEFRRSIGYIEEAIIKPSYVEIIILTWTDHFLFFIEGYGSYITWLLASASAILASLFVWNRMSQRHIYLVLFLALYFYEVFITYKETEQQEYEKFISALNKCKWYFWTSHCEVSPPDPIVFFRHMHPLKIGMRIFSMVVSEPIIAINSAVKVMVDGLTDGLWFPLNKIVYGGMMVLVTMFLVAALVMVLFNYLLNIPFNLSFFAGLVSIGVKQRKTNNSPHFNSLPPPAPSIDHGDRISGQNLDKLLNFCANALSSKSSVQNNKPLPSIKARSIKKSASAGRLTDLVHDDLAFTRSSRFRTDFKREIGSGDS